MTARLSKRLSELGLASRREADDWISKGWVLVDGEIAITGQKVPADLPANRIKIQHKAQVQQQQKVTVVLHKPIGYVSNLAEHGYEPAIVLVTPENHWREDPVKIPFSRQHLKGLAASGRLDIDSTGMLILTQDGRIAKHLIGQDSTTDKEYLVRVADAQGYEGIQNRVPPEKLRLLNHGLSLDGVKLKTAQVKWLNENQLQFVLHEGKKRQIRRMCEAVGLKVVGLKRVRIGKVPLGALPLGQWRYLAPHEVF
ncbi:MAG: pseudouridine synthase [Saezia sp.]